jgi:hypothetical protein
MARGARGCRIATRHGVPPSCVPITRTSPARLTRPPKIACPAQIVAARSAAYSLPMPPKSISMALAGQAHAAVRPLDAAPVDEAQAIVDRLLRRDARGRASEVPRASQHARGDVEPAAAHLVAMIRIAQQRGRLIVDRNRL